jgi:hypothetical protein
MLSQRIEDNRDPAAVYIEGERERLLEAQGCRDLVEAILRLAIRDAASERSRRAKAALRFLRSRSASKLAELIGLDSTALAREAIRLQGTPPRRRRRQGGPSRG